MILIKGIDVILHVKTKSGEDGFGHPLYSYNDKVVSNVLVGSPTPEEVASTINLVGKRIVFILAIPKGNTDNWENAKVSFFGRTFETYGAITEGIESLVPTPWHKQIRCVECENA